MSKVLSKEDFIITQLILESWVDYHAAPDKNIMYVGSETFSPRQIMNYFKEQREPIAHIVNNVDVVELIETLEKSS